MAEAPAPIIIKRVRKGGHGHHGGAWKVAFADFVTAMMAFFMLMWLLNSTSVEQKKVIAAYFNDPLATTGFTGSGGGNPALDGGDGFLDGRGQSPLTGRSEDDLAVSHGDDQDSAEATDQAAIERQRMQRMLEELEQVIAAGRALADFADQLKFDITEEGLRIQIVDRDNRPMFDTGAATLKPYAVDILREIVDVITAAPNPISISGHTDNMAYAHAGAYGNWELSADRANAARRALVAAGLPAARIARVVGRADSEPYDPAHPDAPVNRRISIVVLRSSALSDTTAAADSADAASPTATVTRGAAGTDVNTPPAGTAEAQGPGVDEWTRGAVSSPE